MKPRRTRSRQIGLYTIAILVLLAAPFLAYVIALLQIPGNLMLLIAVVLITLAYDYEHTFKN